MYSEDRYNHKAKSLKNIYFFYYEVIKLTQETPVLLGHRDGLYDMSSSQHKNT